MSDPEIGPQREHVDPQSTQAFERTVGSLAEGGLIMPAPFDLLTASALLRNADKGEAALRLFEVDTKRPLHFNVMITAMVPDQPELGEREIINTVAHGIPPLVAILEAILEEIDPQS